MSPQMSRILQGVIVPKSDVLYLSTESKHQQQMFLCESEAAAAIS